VLDIHYYPGSSDAATCVQFHRVFFDRNYVYPEANGVHTVTGGWDTSINKEFIFGRCTDWMTKYMGANNGVGLAVTECGMASTNANVQAVWYASTMGEFMKNGVEIFTPWSWNVGMWETIHLFSRYNQENFVQATSQDETLISAYPTVNATTDSMTVVLVNRSLTLAKTVNLNFAGYTIDDRTYSMYSLSKLGTAETFVSHTTNALVKTNVTASGNQINIELAPLSVNAIILKGLNTAIKPELEKTSFKASVYPNPATDQVHLDFSLPESSPMNIGLFNANGQLLRTISNAVFEAGSHQIDLNMDNLSAGVYWIRLQSDQSIQTIKIIKK
jgi:hypothetical protein